MGILHVRLCLMHVLILVSALHKNMHHQPIIRSIYIDVIPWVVPFPKPKPKYPYERKPTYQTMNVLHLSDWHVDPEYEVN